MPAKSNKTIKEVQNRQSRKTPSNSLFNDKFSPSEKAYIKDLSKTLAGQIKSDNFEKTFASTKEVLELVGMGVFVAASFAMPGFPRALKSYVNLQNLDAPEPWRRFNIKYLKRTLKRLEKQKLVAITESNGQQIVTITDHGRRKILKFSLDSVVIKQPKHWDGVWRLVSYDVPDEFYLLRRQIKEYLKAWGFYELHESAYLHAYPCEKEVEYLREYLGAGQYLRIIKAIEIENDKPFRDYFDV